MANCLFRKFALPQPSSLRATCLRPLEASTEAYGPLCCPLAATQPNPLTTVNTKREYLLSEPQAVAILAALKLLDPGRVSQMLPETKGELSLAYHRLTGALSGNLNGPHTNEGARGLI